MKMLFTASALNSVSKKALLVALFSLSPLFAQAGKATPMTAIPDGVFEGPVTLQTSDGKIHQGQMHLTKLDDTILNSMVETDLGEAIMLLSMKFNPDGTCIEQSGFKRAGLCANGEMRLGTQFTNGDDRFNVISDRYTFTENTVTVNLNTVEIKTQNGVKVSTITNTSGTLTKTAATPSSR